MLRRRLLSGLLILVTLLWVVGVAAVLLMRRSASTPACGCDYGSSTPRNRCAPSPPRSTSITCRRWPPSRCPVRTGTFTTGSTRTSRKPWKCFTAANAPMSAGASFLKARPGGPKLQTDLRGLFRRQFHIVAERGRLLQSISLQTQRLTDLSDNMMALERRNCRGAGRIIRDNTTFFIWSSCCSERRSPF